MRTTRNGVLFIARREALVLSAYQDGPHMSVGFGHNNPKLRTGDTVTVKSAFRMLKADVADRETQLAKKFTYPLKSHQWDAMMSLYYQSGNRCINDIAPLINKGRLDEAMELLVKCDTNLAGDHIPGLAKRRLMERRVFESADYGELNPIPFWKGNPRETKQDWYEVKEDDL
jgi:GH24 family phage-related lysozyme (muramidase)